MANKDFAKAVTLFYEKFLKAVADSVIALANIENEFKDDYQKLKEVQKDPSAIFDKLKDLSDEEKNNLLVLFARISRFEGRMLRLFDLSVDEKRQLAKELNEFVETIKKENDD